MLYMVSSSPIIALAIITLAFITPSILHAQSVTVKGQITCIETGEPLEFATIVEQHTRLWTTSDAQGEFDLQHLPQGNITLEIRTFGYSPQFVTLKLMHDTLGLQIRMKQESLKLDSVTVTAQRASHTSTSSYVIDRTSLDHLQILNTADIKALLPGGKTEGNNSLMSDARIALRSQGSSEMGNTAFGTAIEVDGIRLQQNGQMSLNGASTRTIAASNIASVEVVTGIPSVEFGDLSNGIVRIHTQQSKSPYRVNFTTRPHTKMVSLSKGWQLGERRNGKLGVLNASLEHARSISNLTSPYTTYQRNVLTLSYNHALARHLRIQSTVTGNVGGYNSESDPDAFTDTWTRVKDYVMRAKIGLDWNPNKPWMSRLQFHVNGSWANQRNETRSNVSSSSAQPQIHATTEGYHVAVDYDEQPHAPIILSPVGYWYRTAVTDNQPYSLSTCIKGEWNFLHTFRNEATLSCLLKGGLDYDMTGNAGRGSYYNDLRVAPTWREARYDTLPAQHALAAYLEPRFTLHTPHDWRLTFIPGLREDVTVIGQSEYGATSALSPRFNARLEHKNLALFGGWGKAVKLPSMQVLYPTTTYQDQLTFAPGSMADGRSYYAYYTHPSRAKFNPQLKWQYSLQQELGLEGQWRGNRLTLSGYRITTHRPYLATSIYSPYSYRFTSQKDLESSHIPSANRQYSIDQQTGIVTVSDRTGQLPDEVLQGTPRNAYLSNTQYINGSASTRMGLEWVLDLARIQPLHTDIRIDGNLTRYEGQETSLIAYRPSSTLTMTNGQPYAYIGYFEGGDNISNGQLTRQLNTNLTISTHIPAVRLILSVRLEATFLNYCQRKQSHLTPIENGYYAVYPRYYSTWEEPSHLIPFEEALTEAQTANPELYKELYKLILRSNTDYFFKANRISPYLCGNLNITKEIGDHFSIAFQATNFWNQTGKVRSSQTGRENTLYGSGYVPSFYYSLQVKIQI